MRHHNSVLREVLKSIPWRVFSRLIDEHQADARVRQLSCKDQLIAMLYGQLSGASSLREIEAGLKSHAARLYHVGAREAARSTLADANAKRPHQVFSGLLAHMMGRLPRQGRRDVAEAVRLIDATGIRLSGIASDWAAFSAGFCSVKAHVMFDPNADAPLWLDITPARTNDIVPARTIPIEPGATYVFDMAYYDFCWWWKLNEQGCRFVTRLKKHTQLTIVEERQLPKGGGIAGSQILHDRIGFLPSRRASSRTPVYEDAVREIGVVLESGKTLRIASNDLDAPAQEIADLYKQRWAIELFFKWVKQTLKIKHFLGRSENAVRIQIAIALIAYLLLRIAKNAAKTIESPLAFARLVRANLMHRRGLDQLAIPPPTPSNYPKQLQLNLVTT
jgi:hypothetical protein